MTSFSFSPAEIVVPQGATVTRVVGEGGALVALEHTRYMAGLGFSPTTTP